MSDGKAFRGNREALPRNRTVSVLLEFIQHFIYLNIFELMVFKLL
jgi:hypothetical protein